MSQSLANGRLESWEPTYDDVADLVADARRGIGAEEYLRRAREQASR